MRKIIKFLSGIGGGGVDLQNLQLNELPDLSDVHVDCSFYCGFNNLTNLVGAPKSVGGNFWCLKNNLTSLIGGPATVDVDYICRSNDLTSLEGAPKIIPYTFNCAYNNLTSLIGAPETVGNNFYCNYNDLTSLEGIPKYIGYGEYFGDQGYFWISKELKDRFPEEYIRSLSVIRGKVIYF